MLSSCASLSSYQDARTVEAGKARVFIGGGTYTEAYPKQDSEFAESIATALENYKTPLIEAGLRVGVTEKIDLGLKYTLPGGAVFDGKYQLLGDSASSFVVSTGAKFGYLSIKQTTTIGGNEVESEWTTLDATLPIYLSYYPVDWFAITVNPNYTFRSAFAPDVETATSNIYGANTSVKLGKNWGLIVEYGYHMTDAEGVDAYQQFGGVLFWPIDFGFDLKKFF
jgi:hypothetical protein